MAPTTTSPNPSISRWSWLESMRSCAPGRRLRRRGPAAARSALPERSLEILRPVCDVLAEAHAAGLVHRDIKPANIFLHRTPGGAELVKVLDFGIVKLIGEAATLKSLTLEGEVVGSTTYIAPERWLHMSYDGSADVFSLGITLFEMLTGHKPPPKLDSSSLWDLLESDHGNRWGRDHGI